MGFIFAALYSSDIYYNGTPLYRLTHVRSVAIKLPYFFYLDFFYPLLMTLVTLFLSPAEATNDFLWKSTSALWIFTAIGWIFRGTIFDCTYLIASAWQKWTGSAKRTDVSNVIDVPAEELLEELNQTAVDFILAIFNVIWIFLTFTFTFPNSHSFIDTLTKIFGKFERPEQDDI